MIPKIKIGLQRSQELRSQIRFGVVCLNHRLFENTCFNPACSLPNHHAVFSSIAFSWVLRQAQPPFAYIGMTTQLEDASCFSIACNSISYPISLPTSAFALAFAFTLGTAAGFLRQATFAALGWTK